MRIATCLLAGCLGLLFVGCGESSRVAPPEVSLLNLGKVRFQGLGGTSEMRIRIGNPNPDPITLEGVHVNLFANDSKFAKGMLGVNQAIPAYGNLDIQVPATISNLALLRAGVKATATRKIAYRMETDATFKDTTGSRHTRTIKKSGDLDGNFLGR